MIIQIDGIIDSWVASDVRRELNNLNGKDVTIEISSPGGFVFAGLRIFNLLKNYKGHVTTHIMGLAASMASVIALAGNKVLAEENSVYMIHNASTYTSGDHRVLIKTAKNLEGVSNLLAKNYVLKTGKKLAEIQKMMDDETYFFGNEMKKAGFVDEMVKTKKGDKKGLTNLSSEDALAYAQLEIEECVNKIKAEKENPEDQNKIAALLVEDINAHSAQTPAQADNTEEVTIMTLVEMMAANPAMEAEIKALKEEQFAAGLKKGQEDSQAKITKVVPFLKKDSEYPAGIQAVALKVLAGDITAESFDVAVTMYDAEKEGERSGNAQGENGDDTPPADTVALSEDGTINNDADFDAAVATMKNEPTEG